MERREEGLVALNASEERAKTNEQGFSRGSNRRLGKSRRVYMRPMVREQATTIIGPGGVPIAMASNVSLYDRCIKDGNSGTDFHELLGSFEEYTKPFISMPEDPLLEDNESGLEALNKGVPWRSRAIRYSAHTATCGQLLSFPPKTQDTVATYTSDDAKFCRKKHLHNSNCIGWHVESSSWQPAAKLDQEQFGNRLFSTETLGSSFKPETLKGAYRTRSTSLSSPGLLCWLIGCAMLTFLMLCSAILYIACLQPMRFSMTRGQLKITSIMSEAAEDHMNGDLKLHWHDLVIVNPNVMPQYLTSLAVTVLGIRDAKSTYWYNLHNHSNNFDKFRLYCNNSRRGNCSRKVPAYSPFAKLNSRVSLAVEGETKLVPKDVVHIFSRNITSGDSWPPVVMLRTFAYYTNPLFQAETPSSVEDMACSAINMTSVSHKSGQGFIESINFVCQTRW